MRYALVNGIQTDPTPKLQGLCRCCSLPVIPKCGRFKVWHWAHRSKDHCDRWWEAETEWHRNWKDCFPQDWQEVIHYDSETGEKHIADVKTEHDFVIEFQHSLLSPQELQSRETFYNNMVWVVDGRRSEFDAVHFRLGLGNEPLDLPDSPTAFPFAWFGRGKLIQTWSTAKHPVFLDFGEEVLWHLLLYDLSKNRGAVRPVFRNEQINDFIIGSPIPRVISE